MVLKFTNTKQLDSVPLLFCVDEDLVLLGRIERGLIVYSGHSSVEYAEICPIFSVCWGCFSMGGFAHKFALKIFISSALIYGIVCAVIAR